MYITYTFFVDFARPQRTNELLVSQYDDMSRVARFVLMNNGKPLDIDEEYAVTVNALLPDESVVLVEAALSEDEEGNQINEILFPIPSVMTKAVGKSTLTISVYKKSEGNVPSHQLSSFEFYVNTRNEIYSGSQQDEDEIAGLRDLMERAADAIATVEQFAAQTALPNPFPLRTLMEGETYDYNGSSMVTLNFGNVLSDVANLKQAFPAGCRQIAQAVTDNGVTTAENASPSTIAENIGKIRSGGDAAQGEILTGKTAYVNKVLVNGNMPNRGAVVQSLNCGQTYGGDSNTNGYYSKVKITANSLASQTGVDNGKTAVGTAQMLTGYQGWVNGSKVTGAMANNGTWSKTLNCGDSYTVPVGFHNGSGKVTANSLASQTSGTATDDKILKGYTAWVNGVKRTGSYVPPSASGERTFNVKVSRDVDHENGIRSVVTCDLNLKVSVNGSTITLTPSSGSIDNITYMWIDNSWTRRGNINIASSALTIT